MSTLGIYIKAFNKVVRSGKHDQASIEQLMYETAREHFHKLDPSSLPIIRRAIDDEIKEAEK